MPSRKAWRWLGPLARWLWPLTRPVRWYWLRSERKLGKGFVIDRLLKPLLPAPPATFSSVLPGGGTVLLQHREDIALVTMLGGGFEIAETRFLRAAATPGTTAI